MDDVPSLEMGIRLACCLDREAFRLSSGEEELPSGMGSRVVAPIP